MLAVALLALVSSGTIVFGFLDERERIRELARERTYRSAQEIAARQIRAIENARVLLIAISELPGVRTRDPEACTPALVRLGERLPNYTSFNVADIDGDVWCSGRPETLPVDFGDRAWFEATLSTREFTVSEYIVSRTTGRPILSLSHPLLDASGAPVGVVFTGIDLEWFQGLAMPDALPAGSSITLLDADGTIVARLPGGEDWVGFEAGDTGFLERAIGPDSREFTVATGLDGVRNLFTFLPLGSQIPNLLVSVGIPIDVAYADLRSSLVRELVVLAIAAGLLVLLLWWGADRYVLAKVRRLLATTARVRDGDLSARTGLTQRGELDRLGQAFDEMTRSLQEQTSIAARALRDLQEHEERYRLLTDASRDLVCLHDPDGTYRFVSPASRELLGYEPDQLLGTQPWALIHPDDLWAVREITQPGPGASTPDTNIQHRMQRRDGSWVWVETLVQPIEDLSGAVRLLQSTSRDVTDRKEAEIRLAELNESLRRSNQELQEFTSVASHDLQEPLRKIQAFGDRLDTKFGHALDESGRAYLEKMRDAAKRMQALIQDLLSYSRVTTSAQPFSTIDLEAVAREALEDLEYRISRTDGSVQLDTLPSIEADPTQMRLLFQNLLGNALKYHREGIPPVVRVRGRTTTDGWVEIFVEDNGIGFEEKYLDRIFAPFQRLHGRGTYEGTGIGLAICRKIVERHGGTLTATSAPGEGSVFVVRLPVVQGRGGPA